VKRLITVWSTVLAVAMILAIPALAQSVPDAPGAAVSGAPDGELEQSKGPESLSNALPPDASPPSAPPPDGLFPSNTLLDTPLSGSPSLEDISEQKTSYDDEASRAVEDQTGGNEPIREAGDQGVGSSQTKGEVEEQEAEDREVEIDRFGKAGTGKSGDGKAGDPKQEFEQDADSGDVDQSVDVVNTGDNVNLCLGVLQAANTGNAQNAQGAVQDGSEADEVELEGGSSITVTPQLIVDCRQIIYQIATGQRPVTGSRDVDAVLRSAALRGGDNVPGFGHLGIETNRAALKGAGSSSVGLSKSTTPRSLPRTGGGTLLGLGAGGLLVAGGLVVRKIFR